MTDSPDAESAEALSNRGTALRVAGNVDEAIACFHRAIELCPDVAALHYNLANTFKASGKSAQAIDSYRRAIELTPDLAVAHYNLGTTLREMGLVDDAIRHLTAATRLNPSFAEAYGNLAVALQEQGDVESATAAFQRAIQLQPDNATNYNNLGNLVLKDVGNVDAAIAYYQKALAIRPDYPQAFSNLGAAIEQKGQLEDAVKCYTRAIQLDPADAGAHRNLALMRLLSGDFERGWTEYEWRWKTDDMPRREFMEPRWRGEDLPGRTILIWAEQGFGDTFQFIRYAALLKERGATVVVECQKALKNVLASCAGIDQLIGRNDPPPTVDFQVPLLSLPGVFKTDFGNVPINVPYLSADETLAAEWRERLQAAPGFRIGINWSGREGRGAFRRRDIPLELFSALAELPNVQLISLQKGAARSALAERLPIFDPGDDFDHSHGAFMDTAAIMRNVDLVITSDTSIPHLAGALGVPVWVALPLVPDWRWLLGRADSPWYPTMRLFRQQVMDDWHTVFQQIREACQTASAAKLFARCDSAGPAIPR